MSRSSIRSMLLVLLVLALLLLPRQHVAADAGTIALTNGAFYTQTSPQAGSGFAITDEGVDTRGQLIRFWSEFQRLGGVAALGYPVSQRFSWDGFVCLATQRVIMQWHPETNGVAFVNVFDLASAAGKDTYLEAVRQVPPPASYNDTGKPFAQIVSERLAVLAARPALQAAYLRSGNAAVDLNGLPVAPIRDMGNVYVLRAQRVVFQEWKQDVPWAKAGQVTVALGGDIAKELGLIQAVAPAAITPVSLARYQVANSVTAAQVTSDLALQPAVQLLIQYDQEHQTGYMENLAVHHVLVRWAPLTDGVLGAWEPQANTLLIARALLDEGTPVLADVLAHESSHAYSTWHGVQISSEDDCYAEELRAFRHQADVWRWLFPGGKPDPQDSIERSFNTIAFLLQTNPDEFLQELKQTYQGQCRLG